ncbi:hypothetical protein JCM8097_004193 [Rhodosporidiobolus ruineniae]
MYSASSSPASSAAPSPYLPSHATIPLLRDFEQSKELPSSPSLPPLPADAKRAAWRPSARLAPVIGGGLLVVGALFFLLSSMSSSSSAYLDAVSPFQSSSKLLRAFHAPPAQPLDEGGFVVALPKTDHTVTTIFLHGLGGSSWDLNWPLPSLQKAHPHVKWVAPSADYLPVTVRGGETTRAWFDIETFDDLYKNEDIAGYTHSQQQLNRLIEEERQRLISQGKEPRIVLMGFSQGGAMALLNLLTDETASHIEAVVVLSTFLPFAYQIPKLASPAVRDVPLFWAHGEADEYLTLAHAHEAVKTLRNDVGMKHVTFKSYDGLGHNWSDVELAEMAEWFAENIPAVRDSAVASSTAPSSSLTYASSPEDASFPFSASELEEMASSSSSSSLSSEDVKIVDAVEQLEALEVEAKADLPARRLHRRSASPHAHRNHREGPKRLHWAIKGGSASVVA